MRYKKIVITGRVQGVGFREFLRREVAAIGGLVGYAKNLKDGNLEVIVSGEDEKIKKLAERCKKGPLLASIKNVSVEDFELDDEFDSFIIRP
jgi:acylphosphatase